MRFIKPKFWDLKKPNFFALALFPFSILFNFFSLFNLKKKIKREKILTICVGNIYIGGTGKTSLAIALKKALEKEGKKVCFIKKFYNNQIDEQKLLIQNGKTFIEKKRVDSLDKAISHGYEIAIFDDGLQDSSIDYNQKLVCFNKLNWIGNGLIIPSGPLRENIKSLRKYNNIFLNGNDEKIDNIINEIKNISEDINIFEAKYEPTNLEKFDESEKYLAFSGIGNHQTFVNMLKNNKLKIIKDIEFPDHYNYRVEDIDQIISKSKALGTKIITTEKDFVKLDKSKKDQINYIKIDLVVQDLNRIIKKLI
tara:strand:+ start:263 stop:1189 length:927 start_codon:yes stop_codon:yes gene_type:complete